MDLKAFLMENVQSDITLEIAVSNRFKDEKGKPMNFKIKAISENQNAILRKSCEKRIKQKYGQYTTETDTTEYLARLISECTVFPDFKDASLQKSWGVMGAESLVKKMLLPGEYTNLLSKVQEICGFEEDINEVKEQVKN